MNLKKYTEFCTIAATLLCLSSCNSLQNSFNKNSARNVSSFTPLIKAETSHGNVNIPAANSLMNWQDINTNNSYANNIKINDISSSSKQYALKGLTSIAASPIIIDEKLYLLDKGGRLLTYNLADFTLEHIYDLGKSKKSYHRGGLTYDQGRLYITNGTFNITVFDPATKQILASKALPDVIKAPPVIAGNKLLVLTISNQLFALDKNTLQTIWLYQGAPVLLFEENTISPIVHGSSAIVACSSGELISIDLDQGIAKWRTDLNIDSKSSLPDFTPVNIVSHIISSEGYAYLASASGGIYKIDMQNGKILWRKDIQDVHNINKIGNIVIGVTNAKQALAIDVHSGLIVWVKNLSDEAQPGKKAAKKHQEFMTPLSINGNIVLIAATGQLYQLDPKNGDILQQITTKKIKSIAVDRNYLYTIGGKKLTVFGQQ